MADTIKDKFKQASLYLNTGEKAKAKKVFLDIFRKPENTGQKLNAILGLLDSLSPVKELDDLLNYCNEGLKLTSELQDKEMEALIKARKAVFLQNKSFHLIYERDCLKLSRDWVAFALEVEKNRYEYLENKISLYKKDTEELFSQALRIAENLGDLILQGRVLMMEAGLLGSEYLHIITDFVTKKPMYKTRLFNKYWVKLMRLDTYLVFNSKERKRLRQIIKNCENKFLQSAKCFKDAGNENMIGYSYYNLAIPLNSAFQFKKAWHYLGLAKKIAVKYKDVGLMRSVKDLELTLKEKNHKYYTE